MAIISEAQARLIYSTIKYISREYQYIYNNQYSDYLEIFIQIASQTLELIAGCDAPYHNLEHTVNVALVGQQIISGKHSVGERISPAEWINYIVSLLCHDIGYVKGACCADQPAAHRFSTGLNQDWITLSPLATGASLTPYHVDRGQLFVSESLRHYDFIDLDSIHKNIELTRFPVPNDQQHKDIIDFPGLTRGADLIGQLSDPSYLAKLPALFAEFEEIGSSKVLGYSNSQDLRTGYPRFYWNVISLYLQHAIRYLEVTQSGKAILENLYGNRILVEKELDRFYRSKSGPFNHMFDWLKSPNAALLDQL